MSSPQLSRRLTSMDAKFLYFERPDTPLDIGSVHIFDGEIFLDALVTEIAAKLPQLPRYQQKAVPAPLNLGHPTWEFDAHFDLSNHIFSHQLAPGSEVELMQLAGTIFSIPLDRDKPLWEMHLVEGLAEGQSALIVRVHHCLADGVSSAELVSLLFESAPAVSPAISVASAEPSIKPSPEPSSFLPTSPSNEIERCFEALQGTMQESHDRWRDFQQGLSNLMQKMADPSVRAAWWQMVDRLPALMTPVARLPFNQPCTGNRTIAWTALPLAKIYALRTALGGTVNDVVLTLLADALSRYMTHHGQAVTGQTARVMVAVSLRQEEQRGTLGNLVSSLLVDLPLDQPDPIQRFQSIRQQTLAMKQGHIAEGVNLLSALLGLLPAPIQASGGVLFHLPFLPLNVNLMLSNVRGSATPLYFQQRRMLTYYPYVPVGYRLGYSCAVVSYDQQLYVGLIADASAMPDVETLKTIWEDCFSDLKLASLAGTLP